MKKSLLVLMCSIMIGLVANAQPFTDITADAPNVDVDGITIDGEIDGSYSAAIDFLGFNGTNVPTDDADLSGSYNLAWSANGLYVFISVTDEAYDFAEDVEWVGDMYKFDNVEIFFNTDLTNDAADGARQPEDKQIRITVGTQIVAENINSANAIADQEYTMVTSAGSYVVETFIPWAGVTSEGFAIGADSEIGFTINVGDSDTPGGNREMIMLWAGAGTDDFQYKNTQYYGYVTLLAGEGSSAINNVSANTLNVFPNPTSDVVTIKNMTSDVAIYNAVGQLVMNIMADSKDVTVDVSSFEAGMYFFKSADSVSKILVK